MKKLIISLVLISGLTAKAGLLDFFDFSKFFEGALTIAEGINENLEKVRLEQQKTLDIREQWDQACAVTQTLNPSLRALNTLLADYHVNSEFCAPITTAIRLQADLIDRCQDYYSKPVPENAEYLIGKFTISILQSKMILAKCYPIINKLKFPGLPGSN